MLRITSSRFIESLSAKVHSAPPSIDKLSDIFQEFYLKAESHIAIHISALSTRQSRGASPNPSISSKSSNIARDGNRLRSSSSKDTLGSVSGVGPEQQMLTPQEISDRRKARRLLDRKGLALEEAVERRVCEKVYSRIWRHRTTLDEVRDEKLRSRTAALALVGIGLQDLGINFDAPSADGNGAKIEVWISKARDCLLKMSDSQYPLGKLQQLAAAHKSIVDLLTVLHQSSSSADEILPTLIYTLITTPPEGINVISNLHFIQRFRASSKVDGEAAYCLTNLEAAITFLETVDLASLRSDEPLEGPPKSTSRPATPHTDSHPEWPSGTITSAFMSAPSSTPITVNSQLPTFDHPMQSPSLTKPSSPSSSSHQRRLSNLFQPPASAFGAAGDAVRTTADHGIKTIGNTLDNSFKLLFGRLKEHKVAGEGAGVDGTVIVPKTLDDARKLMEPKPAEDEEITSSTVNSIANHSYEQGGSNVKSNDSLLSVFASQKQSRDRSVDSVQSSSSGKRVAFAAGEISIKGKVDPSNQLPVTQHESSPPGNAAVESMRSLGNTLNPLKGFGGMSVMRGFGRSSSSATSTPTLATSASVPAEKSSQGISDVTRDVAESQWPMVKISPPVKRFMDVANVEELKIGEVAELMKDYRRLVGALKNAGAF